MKLKKKVKSLRYYCRKQYRCVNALKQAKRRYKKKIFDMKTMINRLEEKNLISCEISELLKNSGEGCQELIKRQLQVQQKGTLRKKFSPALRSFALTLHFLSPKAYDYLRSTFDFALPNPRTIRKW